MAQALQVSAAATIVATGALLVLSTTTSTALESSLLDGVVTKVIDGDTLRVQLTTGPITVRLGEIDAPESIQPGGGAATPVAVVYLGDENVNAWMVKQGHAWAYRGHVREPDYCVWENAARSLRRGLWAGKHWVAPWDWRMSQRDSLYFVSDYSNTSTAGCIRDVTKSMSFDG